MGGHLGPASVVESLLSQLLALWAETPLSALRRDIVELFIRLRETEYSAVLDRLVGDLQIEPDQTLTLAEAIGVPFVKGQLLKILDEGDAESRIAAAGLLFESHREQSVDVALQVAEHKDIGLKTSATKLLLRAQDTRCVPFLLDLLRDSEFDPLSGLDGFERPLNSEIPAAVATLLNIDNVEIQGNAAGLLVNWHDSRGIQTFINLMAGGMPVPRGFYATIDELPSLDVEILRQLLQSSDQSVRLFVARLLVQRDDPAGIEAFLLEKPNVHSLAMVAESLAASKLPEAEAATNQLLSSPDPQEHIAMAAALLGNGDSTGREFVVQCLSSDDLDLRILAVEALVGESHLPLIESIQPISESASIALQRRAVTALGKIKGAKALKALIAMLDDKRPPLLRLALAILISRGEQRAIKAISDRLPELMKGFQDDASPWRPIEKRAIANSIYQFLKLRLSPDGKLTTSAADVTTDHGQSPRGSARRDAR